MDKQQRKAGKQLRAGSVQQAGQGAGQRKKISAEGPSKNAGTWILSRLRRKILSTAAFLTERERASKQKLFSLSGSLSRLPLPALSAASLLSAAIYPCLLWRLMILFLVNMV
mgnify:CR=1 FL=1